MKGNKLFSFKTKYLIAIIFLTFLNILMCYDIDFKTQQVINENTIKIEAQIKLDKDENLHYQDFKASANNPDFKITELKATETFLDSDDKKEHKQGFGDIVNFSFNVEKKPESLLNNTILIVQFRTNKMQYPEQKLVNLSFSSIENNKNSVIKYDSSPTSEVKSPKAPFCPVPQPSLAAGFTLKIKNKVSLWATNSKEWLLSLFKTTGSSGLRFLIVFLIGILLSLTPCIYPMIPITVGVLQANQTKSAIRGFLLALAYTFGISTTFAIFGLIATLTSCVFGEFQGSIWLVLPIALLLFYFGFSMLGAYELYIPRFLRPKAHNVKGGSLFSAYTFGIISGSVASPCLSSGLIFVLNYVTTLTAVGTIWGYIEGLLLLFAFGVGSSLPLLIIGTFSTSLNLLPKAGMWMVEVNKIIGLLLIGMGFYHLSNLERFIPWQILVFIISLSLFAAGIYYLISTHKNDSAAMKIYKVLLSTAFLVAGSITTVQGLKYLFTADNGISHSNFWLTDYVEAFEKAKNQNKPLFIDIGATYCGACKELDKQIFTQPEIRQILIEEYIPLQIEADLNIEGYAKAKQDFSKYIKGYPTYLVVRIDDKNKINVIANWSVDLGDFSTEEIINILNKYVK